MNLDHDEMYRAWHKQVYGEHNGFIFMYVLLMLGPLLFVTIFMSWSMAKDYEGGSKMPKKYVILEK